MLNHDEILKLVRYMKFSGGIWFGKDCYGDSFEDKCYKIFISIKLPVMVTLLALCYVGLFLNFDVITLGDGVIFNIMMFTQTVVLNFFCMADQNRLEDLLVALDATFTANGEPSIVEIRNKSIRLAWALGKFFFKYNKFLLTALFFGPLLADLMFHVVFDILDHPLHIASPMSAFVMPSPTWGVKLYVVHALGCLCSKQCYSSMACDVYVNFILTSYFKGEISVLRNYLCQPGDLQTELFLETTAKRHVHTIKLYKKFKNFSGLRVAFSTMFIAFTLTIILTTCITSKSALQTVHSVMLAMPYMVGITQYCMAGQLLQNECERFFEDCYNVQWQLFNAKDRRTLVMIMRQAEVPLTMDYHLAMPMSGATLNQLFHMIYSLLTVIKRFTN